VFDWMIKNPGPTGTITAKNEEGKQNEGDTQQNEVQTDN